MIKQQVQFKPSLPGTTFLVPEPPRKATHKVSVQPPQVVWEIPSPDFTIPDEPMDNFDQSLLAEALRDALSCAEYFSEDQMCATSVAVCAKVGGRTITKAPDWFYVPEVIPTDQNRHSYTPIAEGKRPTIVMEFLSDDKGNEYDDSPIPPYGKWYFYEQIVQVPWYVIFDSENGHLEVYHLQRGHYQRQTSSSKGRYWLNSLKLFLGVWEGVKKDVKRKTFWLCWWDTNGNRLPWRYEKEEQAELKAEQAERDKRAALEQAELDKQTALEKAELDKQTALEQAEFDKQAALEQATHETILRMAKQMLQAHAEIAFIAQVTGLTEEEIQKLNESEIVKPLWY